jgi:Tol biopolymer transport system component
MRRSSPVSLCTVVALGLATVTVLAGPANAYPRPGTTIRVSPTIDAAGKASSAGNADISGEGTHVLFLTTGALDAADTNGVTDCYMKDMETGEIVHPSVTDAGGVANGTCASADVSEDGRFVAWHSTASDLVPGDTNGVADVFVRDLVAGTTTRVSVAGDGAQGNAASTAPSISDDGNTVAFLSSATNLVTGDANGFNDVFVRDIANGTVKRATISSDGMEGATALANFALSGNGRFVVFVHRMPWDGDRSSYDDVFVHDLVTRRTELVSVASDGSQPNGNSFYPSISDDGRYVAFGSFGTNLVANDFNGAADAFVRDRELGVTERVSVTSHGVEANHVVGVPIISGNGRYVTGNFLPTNYGYSDDNGNTDVYVYDRETGAVELASATPDGTSTGNEFSLSPAISDDGRRVAFQTTATNLIEGDAKGGVLLRDLGPALGVGAISGQDQGDDVAVSGWVRLSGSRLFSVGDPRGDGVASLGADLTGASATFRPEEGDVMFRLDLAPRTHAWAPLAGTTARKPGGVTYVVELSMGGVRHEIRATQTAAPTGTTFGLFRCETACTSIETLAGGDSTVGDAVVISVPVDKLGGEGTQLELTRAFVAAGDAQTGQVRLLDNVGLTAAEIPTVTVELTAAPAGSGPKDVVFDTPAAVAEGRFSQRVPLGTGSREVWARVCVGADCRVTKAAGLY